MPEWKLNGPQQPPTVRCFVGARVTPVAARRLLADFLSRYPEFGDVSSDGSRTQRRDVRPVPLANLHVTIRFLGSVQEPELGALVALVDALAATPLTVDALAYAGLPRHDRAHAIVADLAPHDTLALWKERLERQVGTEARPFRPHVTLARFRARIRVARLALAEPLQIDLEAPCLFRSDAVPGGVRYTPVTRC